MESGQLRKLLTIESPVSAQDNYGQDVLGYVFVATVWGSINTLSGRQLALSQANTITATSTHQIRIRYRTGLLPTHRITYETSGTLFAYMTDQQFAVLTSAQFAALVSTSPTPPRRFAIDTISDPEERHRELVLTATEIKA
jgi:SPP1 family predicted phage head-tail adaptor